MTAASTCLFYCRVAHFHNLLAIFVENLESGDSNLAKCGQWAKQKPFKKGFGTPNANGMG